MFTPAAAVFDLSGTLLDIASLRDAAANLTADPAAFVAAWREKQIAYTFASALMGIHEDFDGLTDRALRYSAARFGIALDPRHRTSLLAAWSTLLPDPDVAHFGEPAGRFAFVTSNGWDATGAASFGMRVAWCNRARLPDETFGPRPAWVLTSLSELIPALEGSP